MKMSLSSELSVDIIVTCTLDVPLMLLAIIGNALVLNAIFTTPSLRSPSTILLSSLAVSDIAVGLIVQPLHIAKRFSSVELVMILSTATAVLLCSVSLSTMALISVDRFLALQYHMIYNNVITTSRVVFASVVVWLFNSIMAALEAQFSLNFYAAYTLIVLFTIVGSISYFCVYRIVRRHQLQIQLQQQSVQSLNIKNYSRVASLKHTAVNTFVFYFCTIVCYFPWFICSVSSHRGIPVPKAASSVTVTLVYANSSINPFLYCWRLRELRIVVKKTFRKLLRRKQEN